MPKRANTKYYLYDDHEDGRFDFSNLYEPASQKAMVGYYAVGWNTGFQWTGEWQGRTVIGLSTTDPLFHIGQDISQAVQIQRTWAPHAELPWLWEAGQGVNDKLVTECDVAMPISWGNNLRQGNFLLRFEDVSHLQAGTDHGQRLWVQASFFDSQNTARPMYAYKDPYTNGEDVVVNVQIHKGQNTQYFDFSKGMDIQQNAWNDLRHVEVTQTRQQFDNLIRFAEQQTGVDLQNETGYWSLIQAGITAEMASFPVGGYQWDIGHQGAQQMAMDNLGIFDA